MMLGTFTLLLRNILNLNYLKVELKSFLGFLAMGSQILIVEGESIIKMFLAN